MPVNKKPLLEVNFSESGFRRVLASESKDDAPKGFRLINKIMPSNKNIGKVLTPMTDTIRAKISMSLKGRMPKNIDSIKGWNKGKTGIYSKELLHKMSIAKLGKPRLDLRGKKRTDDC